MKHRAILVEVLRNRFQAIVEEMGALILRAGHTVFVKETADFGAAIVSNGGEVAAAPVSTGVALMVGMPCDTAVGLSPSAGRGRGRHLPLQRRARDRRHGHPPARSVLLEADLPRGRRVCYVWTFMHCSDIGGRVPGSISPANTDIFQDGIRIPVTKLFRRGAAERGRPAPLHGQLPHPRPELGRPQGAGRRPQHRREADRGAGDALRTRRGAGRHRAGPRLRRGPGARGFPRDPRRRPTCSGTTSRARSGGAQPIRIKLAMQRPRRRAPDGLLGLRSADSQLLQPADPRARGHWQIVFGLVNFLRSTRLGPRVQLGPGPADLAGGPARAACSTRSPACRWETGRPRRCGCSTWSPARWPGAARPRARRRRRPGLDHGRPAAGPGDRRQQGQRGAAAHGRVGGAPDRRRRSTGSTTRGASSGTCRPRRSRARCRS